MTATSENSPEFYEKIRKACEKLLNRESQEALELIDELQREHPNAPENLFALGLAAYMTHDELMSIHKLMLTKLVYNATSFESAHVKEVYTVMGYEWKSPSDLIFRMDNGDEVAVYNGAVVGDTGGTLAAVESTPM